MKPRVVHHLWSIIIRVAVIFLLYGQLVFWHSPWFGWISFALYLYLLGNWWQEIWRRLFGLRQKAWSTRLLSYGTVIILLSLLSAIFVTWYRLTPPVLTGIFLLTAIVTYGVLTVIRRNSGWQKKMLSLGSGSSIAIFPKHWGVLLSYAVLWIAIFYLLVVSKSSSALESPWQTIHPYVLPLFFVLSIVLGILLVSRYSIKVLLVCVLAQTLLMHLYLPLSHTMPWGGDVWRHIGIERQLVDGKYIYPVAVGDTVERINVGPLVIPKALVSPQKYTYSQLWGISVLLAQTLHIGLPAVNIWLVLLLWSLVVPLLLFRIGAMLFRSWRYGILLAALANIAFPFQALGALSLPVSLGTITFFLGLAWWLQFMHTRNSRQRNLVFGLAALMIFAYPLHTILLWLVIVLTYLLRIVQNDAVWKRVPISSSLGKKIIVTLLIISCLALFPLLEIATHISSVLAPASLVESIKQAVGQFSGWYYASAIRPHDILSGNILFNHTPEHAFVGGVFTNWRWFFIPTMMAFFSLAGVGMYSATREKRGVLLWHTMLFLLISSLGGYLIGWFVLSGNRLFVRRMDAVIFFLLFIFVLQGIRSMRIRNSVVQNIVIVLAIGSMSWIATATYASGPDMRVVSQSEFDAASYIWQEEDHTSNTHCIIADSWALLALEGLSGKEIVGGGFPIDYQFAQPDRVRIYSEMVVDPTSSTLENAQMLTGSERCWVVLPKEHASGDVQEKITSLTGAPLQEVGDLYLWHDVQTSEPLSGDEKER